MYNVLYVDGTIVTMSGTCKTPYPTHSAMALTQRGKISTQGCPPAARASAGVLHDSTVAGLGSAVFEVPVEGPVTSGSAATSTFRTSLLEAD